MSAVNGSANRVVAEWKVESGLVVVGPKAITVLHLRALRDCSITCIKLDAVNCSEDFNCQIIVCEQPAFQGQTTGRRSLRVEEHKGKPHVVAYADLPNCPGDVLLANQLARPHDYWLFRGNVSIPKGMALGIVVQSNKPAQVRVLAAGC